MKFASPDPLAKEVRKQKGCIGRDGAYVLPMVFWWLCSSEQKGISDTQSNGTDGQAR